MDRLKVGFLGVTQLNFGGGGRKDKIFFKSKEGLKEKAKELKFDLYIYPEFVVTREDAIKAKKTLLSEKVDFLLIQSTTYAAGEIITQLAKMDLSIGLWALPETSMEGSFFVESLNSFCGVNMYAGIISHYLKDYGIKYKWFYGDIGSEMFSRRFAITIRALAAIKKMKKSRVALVGGIAPGFNDLYFDERIGQKKLGIEIERNHEYSEIKERAMGYKEWEIQEDMESALSGFKYSCSISKNNLEVHTRFLKANLDFCKEYQYDALALSCWPKIQDEFKCLYCTIIGKLNQLGIPTSCEGDLPGAVGMLLQKHLTDRAIAQMDLSALDEDDQTVLMWHCGPSPEHFENEQGSNLIYSIQPDGTPEHKTIGLINDVVFKPQHLTFIRITGEWDKLFLLDGVAIKEDKKSPQGSRGWVGNLRLNRQDISVRDLMNTIIVQGLQHHYSMNSGDITEELIETAAWLDMELVQAVEYQNYLQVGQRG